MKPTNSSKTKSLILTLIASVWCTPLFSQTVTAIASGETHGMLHSCDCPRDPGGGFAKRATVVKRERESGPVLLLDAGGFSGGGTYDTYTEGRAGDSVRTLAAIEAMGVIGYDAVTPGDDDLQFGAVWIASAAARKKLPLVSANCTNRAGKPVFAPYVLVKKGKITIAITGVTTTEKLFDTDTSVAVGDPFPAVRAVWKEMVARSDMQVILSHCGDGVSAMLADSFPQCDLIVNGHRKASMAPVVSTRGAPVMEFGFQGKALSTVSVDVSKAGVRTGQGAWLGITNDLADNPAITAMLNKYAGVVSQRQVYDLYIMSRCPYGIEAVPQFLAFVTAFNDAVEWRIRFIGNVGPDGALSSLHGPGEVDEDKIWLAVEALYPGRWPEFLRIRCGDGNRPVSDIIKSMKLDPSRIDAWVAAHGDARLAMHFLASTRIGANASPMLFVNNTQSELTVQKDRLAREQCARMPHKPRQCDSLPACIDDSDCKMPGKTGKCDQAAGQPACVYRDALMFTFTIVTSDSFETPADESVTATTRELFPGVRIERVMWTSQKGKRLVAAFKPRALPMYLFDTSVASDEAYPRISSGLVPAGAYLTFRDKVMRPVFYHNRKADSTVILFVDPIADNISDFIAMALADTSGPIGILPILYADPASAATGADEKFRREEAGRWLVLTRDHPGALRAYLREYARNPGTSFWHVALRSAGVNLDEFTVRAMRAQGALDTLWKEIIAFDIQEPAVVVSGNRRVVPVRRGEGIGRALAEALRDRHRR